MIRVTAPARLHFGLLSLPAEGEQFWPNCQGDPVLPARQFGGAGLMIDRPALRLRIEPADDWSVEGPTAERALTFALRFAATLPAGVLGPQRLVVETAPPEHSGLGSGTQLGLAVARALAVAAGLPGLDAVELARRAGRGLRSALGVHGFAQGGFLVEAGKRTEEGVSPLAARVPFPEEWRIVVAIPPAEAGWHGEREQLAFREILARASAVSTTDTLCRLVLLGMLPALAERDLAAFGEAAFDYNARAGEAFAAVQGGTYASRRVAEVVAFVRGQGIRGVGQSSWGPAIFAVVGDGERANDLARRLRQRFALDDGRLFVTTGCDRGAVVGNLSGEAPR